ncbi:TetR/AcrR family transcriptional regulator [Paraglaciecola sp.]|uniref:TetR/AcrR family transcriptional regulator n=1 Tax=Paraglaciecola sp. TaxID=1920173 RepID=UPI0030F3B281
MVKTSQKDMGNRPGTGLQRKGRERIEKILDAATELLIQEGHSQFTMRKLAERLNIRLSNLQYYFTSREKLLQKLLQRFLETSIQEITSLSTKQSRSPRKKLLDAVDYLLQDQEKESSCKIFWELWVLSARDNKVGQIMEEFYQSYSKSFGEMLQELNPEMPPRKVTRIAVLVISMIEGLSLMRGFGKQRHAHIQGIEKELRDAILRLIEA